MQWMVRALLAALLGGSALGVTALGCSDSAGSETTDPGDSGADGGGDMASADAGDDAFVGVPGCEEVVNRRDLGPVSLAANGLSSSLTFDLPECAHSYLLMVEGPDNVTFILDSLTAPDGSTLITGPFPQGQLESPVRMSQGEGVATAMMSNSTVEFQSGQYTAVILGGTIEGGGMFGGTFEPWAGDVDVELLYKGVDTNETGGTLGVNVYLSGAGGITMANAETNQLMQDALDDLREIYGAAGITIGTVTFFDIPESFQTITSIQGPDNMLSEMFAFSGNGPPGLNYFLVDRFDVFGGLGSGIGGISGGLPGPALKTGTPRSGVAVSMSAAQNDASAFAHVMGHEGGHYLGLFHTSEFFGGDDPLTDTPTGQQGSTNLMFPTVGGDTNLTTQQRRVIHNHGEVAP